MPPVPPEAHQDSDVPNGNIEAGISSPLMVVWKESDALLPPDEQHRWDHLAGYNILDTVRKGTGNLLVLTISSCATAVCLMRHTAGAWDVHGGRL